jgi:hypothetical protein
MTADARTTCNFVRRWALAVSVVLLAALVGCKTDKETKGTGVARGKDPLVYGPTRIPRQDLPVPDRATGPNGKTDPLTTPTGGKAGYTDDPERFKGTYIPGKSSVPAALAGRRNDSDELKIADTPAGVTLTQTGGTLSGGLVPTESVEPLYTQLAQYGVKSEDRTLERENGQWVFRAAVPISGNGARRQYTGTGATAVEAIKQVADHIATDRK